MEINVYLSAVAFGGSGGLVALAVRVTREESFEMKLPWQTEVSRFGQAGSAFLLSVVAALAVTLFFLENRFTGPLSAPMLYSFQIVAGFAPLWVFAHLQKIIEGGMK